MVMTSPELDEPTALEELSVCFAPLSVLPHPAKTVMQSMTQRSKDRNLFIIVSYLFFIAVFYCVNYSFIAV